MQTSMTAKYAPTIDASVIPTVLSSFGEAINMMVTTKLATINNNELIPIGDETSLVVNISNIGVNKVTKNKMKLKSNDELLPTFKQTPRIAPTIPTNKTLTTTNNNFFFSCVIVYLPLNVILSNIPKNKIYFYSQ